MPETLPCPAEEWYSSDDVREEIFFGYRPSLTDELALSRIIQYSPHRRRPLTSHAGTAADVFPSGAQHLISEIGAATRESQAMGLAYVDERTEMVAVKFALQLPASVPMPEVAVDPDGEVSFDWLGQAGKIFSVSIDRNGRLAYAGRFGQNSKMNGVEQVSDICPPEILLGIDRAVS